MIDFNVSPQKAELIPNGTVCPLSMRIRPGGFGEDGMLRQSASSDVRMLDCEFTVLSGPYAGRKVWQFLPVSGGKLDENGHSIAAGYTLYKIRSMLESARGISPQDASEEAKKARSINSWSDLNRLSFIARIGIERDSTGRYHDKNIIQSIIRPGMPGYERPAAYAPDPIPEWARD